MKQHFKILIGLLVALTAIGGVCVLALRYMDVLLKPVNAVRNKFSGANDGCCDCDCDDCDEEELSF